MSVVAYLASYLSRAKFISPSFVANMVERVVTWCYNYPKNLNEDTNPKAHKVYYTSCQAIIYVLCFRMRAMLAVPRLRSKLFLTRIKDILSHKLNPLKMCLPYIVEEFLRLAKSTHFFAIPDSLVANGMLESDFSKAFGGQERLDTFFPFDPCLLKKSDRFVLCLCYLKSSGHQSIYLFIFLQRKIPLVQLKYSKKFLSLFTNALHSFLIAVKMQGDI